ncbi:hypothetical protein LSUE1_G001654 [Lachnellula suecica]|uniref:DUF5071 domain-containing protein n=1 Tax=Lachnellula suecica TaxID=602035 RepID=A0A8T9CI13_9HELO|nr:hypothetical protein LSUE1_G001654 [Lachnellula suecica]
MSSFDPRILTKPQRTLEPKDKHDNAAIAHLSTVPESTITPLIPHLLTWLEDVNWPRAAPVRDLILKYPHLVITLMLEILSGDDDSWKDNCLINIVSNISREQQQPLRPVLERIAGDPTAGEMEFELEGISQRILDGNPIVF